MVLTIPGYKNLFPHSKDFDQGFQRGRKRESDVIVALDGTGDFEDFTEGLKEIAAQGGGVLRIRKGTYTYKNMSDLITGITIIGDGENTELETDGTATYPIVIHSKNNIKFKNLKLTFTRNESDDEAPIDLDSNSDLIFEKVLFSMEGHYDGFIWNSFGGSVIGMEIINCNFENSGTLDAGCLIAIISDGKIINNDFGSLTVISVINADFLWDKCFFIGNRLGSFDSDGMRNCVFSNNICSDIALSVGFDSNSGHFNIIANNFVTNTITIDSGADENVISGNQTDTAIVDNGTNNVLTGNNVY